MVSIATNTTVDRDGLLDFARERHPYALITMRKDGRPQVSPVTGGVDGDGRIVISTYPERAKAKNLRREPAVSVLVMYFRCIAGEHDDWDDYRAAMRKQGKSLIRITVDSWGPVATGGFPPPSSTERA